MLVRDFKKALYFAGQLPYETVDAVMAHSVVSNGYVDYKEWLATIDEPSGMSPEKAMPFSPRQSDLDATVRGMVRDSKSDIESSFQERDTNDSGRLPWGDFQKAVAAGMVGWRLQHEHREVLFAGLQQGEDVPYMQWLRNF